MKTKTLLMLCCLLVSICFAQATDMEECFALNEYFNKPVPEVHQKIAEYQNRLKTDKSDYYAHLAIAILYSALSSPMENPEEGASEKIVEHSKAFEKKEKNNVLAMTYYGLGCSLVSRDSRNPFTQLSMVKRAIRTFDTAVEISDGHDLQWFVRYMRGNFYINLPGSFKKRPAAEQDFEFISSYYTAHPEIEGYMCNAYFYLGEIEKTRGNLETAVSFWKHSVSINERLALNAREGEQSAERLTVFAD
ncbi:MAG TPA: hypothetical protein PKH81_04645 [Treponemataceae bacterium]|nr:hypothetical protein [Treponemataceae bacterium]